MFEVCVISGEDLNRIGTKVNKVINDDDFINNLLFSIKLTAIGLLFKWGTIIS